MSRKQKVISLAITAAIALAALTAKANFHKWEDGSWAIGNYPYPVTGCPANQPCSTAPGFAVCASWVDGINENASWYLTEHNFPVADCNGIVEFGE